MTPCNMSHVGVILKGSGVGKGTQRLLLAGGREERKGEEKCGLGSGCGTRAGGYVTAGGNNGNMSLLGS